MFPAGTSVRGNIGDMFVVQVEDESAMEATIEAMEKLRGKDLLGNRAMIVLPPNVTHIKLVPADEFTSARLAHLERTQK